MSCNVFFDKDIKNKTNSYKFEENYLVYFVVSKIYDLDFIEDNELFDLVEKEYGFNLNRKQFNVFTSKHFLSNKGGITAAYNQIDAYEKTKKFKTDLFQLEWDQDETLHNKLNSYLKYTKFDISEAIPYVLAIYKKRNDLSTDEMLFRYFDIIANENKYYMNLDSAVVAVDNEYLELPVKLVINNSISRELLFSNGVNKVRELANLSIESLLTIFSPDITSAYLSIFNLKEENKDSFYNDIDNIFNSLSDKELKILTMRNGLGCEKMTLEEAGQEFGFTRERSRQIEKNATEKVVNASWKITNQLYAMFFNLAVVETRYVSVDDVEQYLGTKLRTEYVLFVLENRDFDIKYSKDFNVIYNIDVAGLDELTAEVTDVYGQIIDLADFNSLNLFEQSVVKKNYKLMYDKYYIHKDLRERELIGYLIDELFPDGYRSWNDTDYELLKSKYLEKYGIDEFPSAHSVRGYLDRLSYCQIDKGTYKNRSQCITLPEDLVEDIINYCLTNGPMVPYASMFSRFKAQLKDLGVNNYFYLKGLIDPKLPSEFVTGRNSLNTSSNVVSSYDAFVNFIRSFNGEFTLDDLRFRFEGVKDYTFYNVLYNEINNGLIWLTSKKYIYISKVVITDDTVAEFKKFIDGVFASLGTCVTSSRKIYAKLSLTNKPLQERLKLARDNFSTFSLIRYLFKDDYGFNRPIISLDKNADTNTYNVIVNYAMSLETFNSKTIRNYVSKMNIGGLYSYLSFMEDMSDNFVQVNIETMIRKDKFEMTDAQVKELDNLVNLIIGRFEQIDTRSFNGYQMLPKVKYHWNKYLLAGVVRSYLADKYEVTNTENSYDLTDFIIRRSE